MGQRGPQPSPLRRRLQRLRPGQSLTLPRRVSQRYAATLAARVSDERTDGRRIATRKQGRRVVVEVA